MMTIFDAYSLGLQGWALGLMSWSGASSPLLTAGGSPVQSTPLPTSSRRSGTRWRPCWTWPLPPQVSESLNPPYIVQEKPPQSSSFLTAGWNGVSCKQAFLQLLVSGPTISSCWHLIKHLEAIQVLVIPCFYLKFFIWNYFQGTKKINVTGLTCQKISLYRK